MKVKYDSEKKEWFGPKLDEMAIEIAMPFGEFLLEKLKQHGDKLIQIDHDTGNHMTCTEMRLKSLKVAEQLGKIGIRRGDNITIIATSSENLSSVFIGALAMGAVVNPLYIGFSVAEFQHFFEMVKPSVIICHDEVIERVHEALYKVNQQVPIYSFEGKNEEVRKVADLLNGYDTRPSEFVPPNYDDDLTNVPTMIICTSGTTGLPKGVLVSHAMALYGLTIWWPMEEGLAYFSTSGFFWITATQALANSIVHCAPRIITDQLKTSDLVLDILEKYSVDSVFLHAPFIAALAKRLESRTSDLTKLRSIQTAGSPLSDTIRENILSKVPSAHLYKVYGISDLGSIITVSCSDNAFNSVGSLFFGVKAKIINENNERLGPDEPGEICVKMPFNILGYLNNEAATRSSFDADGWFLTGDTGYFNDNGDLFLEGRMRDGIKYRFYRLSAFDLECFIEKNFDISAVAVVGIPDDIEVSFPAAVIVAKPGSRVPSEAKIDEAINKNFADSSKLRGGVYFVDSLPHTATGKLQRHLVQKIAIELFNARRSLQNKQISDLEVII